MALIMEFKLATRSNPTDNLTELPALGMDPSSIALDFRRYFSHTLGRGKNCKSIHYLYTALAYTQRDRLIARCKNPLSAND
jgi:starch phosphorylase